VIVNRLTYVVFHNVMQKQPSSEMGDYIALCCTICKLPLSFRQQNT